MNMVLFYNMGLKETIKQKLCLLINFKSQKAAIRVDLAIRYRIWALFSWTVIHNYVGEKVI